MANDKIISEFNRQMRDATERSAEDLKVNIGKCFMHRCRKTFYTVLAYPDEQ